ncbi:MAG: sigma-70 family RNA polymerase sigma factor [Planctomycetaceae bacterium]
MSDGSNGSLLELLNRARDGDDAARERLFVRCRTYVDVIARAHVESWLRAKVDASDIVQQTMLEVHRGLDDFRGGTENEWLCWLRRILAHNAADFVRRYRGTAKRQARREVPLVMRSPNDSREFRRDPSDAGETPSQLVMRREREIEVAEAVAQLPPDYQEIIMLRNLERLPFGEIAQRMNRSRPATQMLWMRALRKLETILKES